MKQIIAIAALSIIHISARAQLVNTRWKAVMNVPTPVPCTLSFSKDTLVLVEAAGTDSGTVVETMKYTTAGNILSLQKISGMSPCGEDVTAKYSFEVKDKKLYLTQVDDQCQERAAAWPATGEIAKLD